LAADLKAVAFGTVRFSFAFIGTRAQTATKPVAGPVTTADFRPLPGQSVDISTSGPRRVLPVEALGVYGADGVRLERAGFWQVTVAADLDGRRVSADAAFEVTERPQLPAGGDPALVVDNPLAGAAGVTPASIDSRALGDAPIPDPELHAISVAEALASRRPLMVVVSTPTYCTSRFCGPITDSVAALASRYGNRMAFVHLEVWQDFEAKKLNPAAAAWINPPGADDAREPAVFTVDATGRIVDRFDNVATDRELNDAVDRLLARAG
jgi:hypothetical protein